MAAAACSSYNVLTNFDDTMGGTLEQDANFIIQRPDVCKFQIIGRAVSGQYNSFHNTWISILV
ncbi:MAG: hypothetical protein AAFR42_05060 [Cyanobacteria bacterium J06628_6]